MLKLILARHGNTFEAGAKTFWVGAREDLPLVERGKEQARELGAALKKSGIQPAQIYCSQLQRTQLFAQITAKELGLQSPAIIDARLNELDYGEWSGKSDEEIGLQDVDGELELWRKHAHWPTRAKFGGSELLVSQEIEAFSKDLLTLCINDESCLVVSSNGRLRYFLKLVAGEFAQRSQTGGLHMNTGSISILRYDRGSWALTAWNIPPQMIFSLGAG